MRSDDCNGYVVGLTADGADATRATMFGDIGLHRLGEAGISWVLLPDLPGRGPVDPAALADVDAVISLATSPSAPISGLTLLLACAHRLLDNHRVTVSGRWASERGAYRGIGVDGRTVGILGFGSVGSELAQMLAPLGVTVIANTRSGNSARAAQLGIELVDRPELAARSDFVVVAAALTAENYGILDEAFFAAMKPAAYFINIARNGLVNQPALTAALRAGIAGAALCWTADDPLFAMDNVICTPHALCGQGRLRLAHGGGNHVVAQRDSSYRSERRGDRRGHLAGRKGTWRRLNGGAVSAARTSGSLTSRGRAGFVRRWSPGRAPDLRQPQGKNCTCPPPAEIFVLQRKTGVTLEALRRAGPGSRRQDAGSTAPSSPSSPAARRQGGSSTPVPGR